MAEREREKERKKSHCPKMTVFVIVGSYRREHQSCMLDKGGHMHTSCNTLKHTYAFAFQKKDMPVREPRQRANLRTMSKG